MANRIVDIYVAILNELNSLKGSDNKPLFKYVNVFNDQIERQLYEKENTAYNFKTPACFIEVALNDPKMLKRNMTSYPECEIILHFIHVSLNNQSSKLMDANFEVFKVKDLLQSKFNGNVNIPYCSTLMCCLDMQDFNHSNSYKYIVGYKTNFIDAKGSEFDQDSDSEWYTIQNPTITVPQLNLFGVNVYYNEEQDNYYINSNGS